MEAGDENCAVVVVRDRETKRKGKKVVEGE